MMFIMDNNDYFVTRKNCSIADVALQKKCLEYIDTVDVNEGE